MSQRAGVRDIIIVAKLRNPVCFINPMSETPEFYEAFIFANFPRFYPHTRSTYTST